MAFPEVSGPSGLMPVNRLDGLPYAGATRLFKIASGYNTSIYNGDLVRIVAGGTVEREAADAAIVTCGVFVGCTYTDPVLGYKVHANYFPANLAADDIEAYVVDDPNAVFKIAVVSSGTTISSVTQSAIGANLALVDNSGNDLTGRSAIAADDGPAVTATLPLRVVDVVEETANTSGGFTEVLVKINTQHQYLSTTGVV